MHEIEYYSILLLFYCVKTWTVSNLGEGRVDLSLDIPVHH